MMILDQHKKRAELVFWHLGTKQKYNKTKSAYEV